MSILYFVEEECHVRADYRPGYWPYSCDYRTGWVVGTSGTIAKTGKLAEMLLWGRLLDSYELMRVATTGFDQSAPEGAILALYGLEDGAGDRAVDQTLQNEPAWLLNGPAVSPLLAYVCGEEGIVLKTEDGGDSWHAVESGTDKHLYGLDFPINHTGCFVSPFATMNADLHQLMDGPD
eukprot:gene22461-27107_t